MAAALWTILVMVPPIAAPMLEPPTDATELLTLAAPELPPEIYRNIAALHSEDGEADESDNPLRILPKREDRRRRAGSGRDPFVAPRLPSLVRPDVGAPKGLAPPDPRSDKAVGRPATTPAR